MNTSNKDSADLISIKISGKGKQWESLQEKIFHLIDSIAQRVNELSDSPETDGIIQSTSDMLKDITSIAASWAQAKIEKPSFENEKLRAEIASEFAEAKRRYAEASKLEAETQKINAENIGIQLDNLERLLKFAEIMGRVGFSRIGNDAHLLIDSDPDTIEN